MLINPVLWTLGASARYYPPDTFQYLELARRIANDLSLYTEGLGHVDAGTILPPLLPALIAVGSLFTENLLAVAEFVSSVSILLAAVPLYLLVARATSRVTAVCCIAFLQLHASYYQVALWPLTEALWILTSSLALLALQTLIKRRAPALGLSLAVGAAGALVFFSRQIGLLFIVFGVAAVLTLSRSAGGHDWRMKGLRAAFVTCGFLILGLPYSLTVFAQTGHHPLKQHFRQGGYVVEATPEDRSVLAQLREDRGASRDYGSVFAGRRQERQLNAEATEMLGSLVDPQRREPGLGERIRRDLSPRGLAQRLLANLTHLRGHLGWGLFTLYCLAMLAPVFGRGRLGRSARHIDLVGLWNLIYLVGLSSQTGLVDRYLIGLLPFSIAMIGMVGHALMMRARATESNALRRVCVGGIAVVLVTAIALTPAFWSSIKRSVKLDVPGLPVDELRDLLDEDEPVFSLTPFEAHLVGARWRMLPNDDLRRIGSYGRHTGVRWLLVTRQSSIAGEARLYTKARWYLDPELPSRPDLPARLRASYGDGTLLLFELDKE